MAIGKSDESEAGHQQETQLGLGHGHPSKLPHRLGARHEDAVGIGCGWGYTIDLLGSGRPTTAARRARIMVESGGGDPDHSVTKSRLSPAL